MKKTVTGLVLLILLSISFYGCSNSSNNSAGSEPETETDPVSEYNGIIQSQDSTEQYWISFWIDYKTIINGVSGDGCYHFYVYTSSTKESKSKIWTQQTYGTSGAITVTDKKIYSGSSSVSRDAINLVSLDGGNSYTGEFLINGAIYLGSITKNPQYDNNWITVSNRNEIVGTWTAYLVSNGINVTEVFRLFPGFTGDMTMAYNFSNTSYSNEQIQTVKTKLENSGYQCTYNSSSKILTATVAISNDNFNEMISQTIIKIHASNKRRLQLSMNGNEIEFVKYYTN